MKIEEQGNVKRVVPCEKDEREAARREFEVKGLDLIMQLQEELYSTRKRYEEG